MAEKDVFQRFTLVYGTFFNVTITFSPSCRCDSESPRLLAISPITPSFQASMSCTVTPKLVNRPVILESCNSIPRLMTASFADQLVYEFKRRVEALRDAVHVADNVFQRGGLGLLPTREKTPADGLPIFLRTFAH